ncbi:MAG TPA: NADH-quinone oxidoreductase subunit NuoH [Leptospiraceae bacterium]|jgi:NADH-quinone oxidoreductase subunit H|nr:NADH-quinone oxidoreductase subunit NuoH [Leptospirales bacterium]HMU82814.1 NADH-quinone oxidoreductase subunit NuoH [Leptospiraceae bacterium]HMW58172.1 NADH-quinone oxidoreductase subunit NuoH [Leptospiraceae bacterium]HMX56440.1 NADH-quinone oxidoreductase subunit NuoH [Leptospiraceae bacterium]HMZ35406.1 NADH-quinone oxidoreductase subunit NuoH [Leptospiraceae bacterium]
MEQLVFIVFKCVTAVVLVLTAVPLMIWMERKVSADFQLRIGPNRMGPAGVFQLPVDAVKLLFKESFAPRGIDRFMYLAAPVVAFVPGLLNFAVIPAGEIRAEQGGLLLAVSDIELGLITILAISSLTSYGIAYAGWASGNQFSLLGGVRSCAQLISYEIVLGLSVLSVIMMSGTLNLSEIVRMQNQLRFGWMPSWNIALLPLTFILFLIAAFAETNRAPFDLPEAEQELVGGYHTEYTGLRYAWFMFGEYAGMFTMCSLITTLFLGGWMLPGLTLPLGILGGILGFGIFLTKVIALIFFFMWVRWTLPRLRWDQLMRFGWKRLIPAGLINLVITAVLVQVWK